MFTENDLVNKQNALYWLLEVEAYDYDIGMLRDADIEGKVLIISSQLWSLIRGSSVISALIGPGIFKGQASTENVKVDVLEYISALLFDPAQLRYDEPLPLVDVVSPEVIDPLGESKQEEIMTVIRKLVLERGNVLTGEKVMRVSSEGLVPQTAHYNEELSKINVRLVSGVQRAKFILAGTNGPLYRPFVERYNNRKYISFEMSKVMATFSSRFSKFDDQETMAEWMIVEKMGTDGKTGSDAITAEYDKIYSFIQKNEESFMFDT
jgi:hypothetical protein